MDTWVNLDDIYKAKLKSLEQNYIYSTKNTRRKLYILIVLILIAINIIIKVRFYVRIKPLIRRDP
jgi:hypothetical protein